MKKLLFDRGEGRGEQIRERVRGPPWLIRASLRGERISNLGFSLTTGPNKHPSGYCRLRFTPFFYPLARPPRPPYK
jgi:hypothetical protein